jgi:nucleoid DNA-binding protein
MNNKELVQQLSSRVSLTQQKTSTLLQAFVGELQEQLLNDNMVHIQHFGDLSVRKLGERLSVHPKTGERTLTPPKLQVVFRQSPELKEEMSNG